MKIGLQSAVASALPTVRAALDPDVASGSLVGPRQLNQMR
jgi:hypothetical protein